MRLMLSALGLLGCSSSSSTRPDGGMSPGDAPVICADKGVEGCACSPVGSGGGGEIAIDRPLLKLVSDPVRCVVYGLASDAVFVFDTRTKSLAARIDLSTPATDIDVAGDGSRAVVGHRVAHQITLLDLEQRGVAGTVTTTIDTARLEVTRNGIVFYVNFDQFSEVHRVDLSSGADVNLQSTVHYQSDLELADDDVRLYIADSSLSESRFAVYDTTDGVFGLIDRSRSDFSGAKRHLFVGATRHVYYADHQWGVPEDPSFMTGGTQEPIYAEDRGGRLAIGRRSVWDTELVRPITSLPANVASAAFAAAGQEVWTYPEGGNSVRFIATAELVGSTPLGQREVPASALAHYQIDQLVYDPSRALLYGRDRAQNAIVAIDAGTLQPTTEVRVGTAPSDLALGADGSALYVGHEDVTGLARIALANFAFDRFVKTPRITYEVEPVAPERLIVIDKFGTTIPTILDVTTGATYPGPNNAHSSSAIAVAGSTLFVGDTASSGCHLSSYAISPTSLTKTGQTAYNDGVGFNSPARIIATTATGSTVFYASHAIDGASVSTIKYPVGGNVRAVSPDGRVGLSSSNVYDVATGANLGALPVTATALAIDPSSQTAFLFANGAITTVDLTTYAP